MNLFLDKARQAVERSSDSTVYQWKDVYAREALAWVALYWAAQNESDKTPLPPGRSEQPTRVLPPERLSPGDQFDRPYPDTGAGYP